MDATRLSKFDLNLLVVLDVLLVERSVTRAAGRLGLSQPAVSNALSRLRAELGDPLLVRSAGGMVPTSRAQALQRELGEALESIESAIGDRASFEPKTARRTFVIAATDYVQFVLLGSLVRGIRKSAPGIVLRVIAPIKAFPWAELASGSIDLVIGGPKIREVPEGVHRRWTFRDDIVCVVRTGHPRAAGTLTLERYLELDHVEALPIGSQGFADEILSSLGHTRRVVVTVPNFLAAPFVVMQSDCCFTLARRIAKPLSELLPLAVRALPFEMPGVAIAAFWHDRVHKDEGHRWLRRAVLETCASLA